jgi:hypothetical protein
MRRVPEWFEQVVGGLSDGKDWVVRRIRSLPTPVRATGWLTFQALLFKIQPHLWHGLLRVVRFVTGLLELKLHVQLLLGVIALLAVQTALAENRFKRLRRVVESMEKLNNESKPAVADGGPEIEVEQKADNWNSARVYAACGAVAGGAIGVGWGPAGVIGLSVLGAMVGDEVAQRTLE